MSNSPRGSRDAVIDFAWRRRLISMRIPHTLLSPTALWAVVEEFVTRDGTDHSSVAQRIELVMCQLDVGSVELHFEQETETCSILPMNDGRNSHASSEDG